MSGGQPVEPRPSRRQRRRARVARELAGIKFASWFVLLGLVGKVVATGALVVAIFCALAGNSPVAALAAVIAVPGIAAFVIGAGVLARRGSLSFGRSPCMIWLIPTWTLASDILDVVH